MTRIHEHNFLPVALSPRGCKFRSGDRPRRRRFALDADLAEERAQPREEEEEDAVVRRVGPAEQQLPAVLRAVQRTEERAAHAVQRGLWHVQF